MKVSPLAGKPPPPSMLADIPKLIAAYYSERPDPGIPEHRVAFGTSGHRGSSLKCGFNEAHILAISQAICRYRGENGIAGPLFLGKDTHALSEPAFITALEVLAANGVSVMIDRGGRYTPTPSVSHAILAHNRNRRGARADGIVITPSHNPPEDGGFKYNPPHGGPADKDATDAIERKANALLAGGLSGVRRVTYRAALGAPGTRRYDYIESYVRDLDSVVDMKAIRRAGVRIGVDPLGGASVDYWPAIVRRFNVNLKVVNDTVDPTFRFMTVDWDGKIRMDCSSPCAMAGLISLKKRFDIAFANDPDADRHGIVTPSAGLLNPNHYLAAAIFHLFRRRKRWKAGAAIGKTVVSSGIIDRVAARLNRRLVEVPVGFKWFVDGLRDGALGFGGEESAGASFLRFDGKTWTTDKDGMVMGLLAAEITATTGRDPAELYRELTERLGAPVYERTDAPATPEQKEKLKRLSPRQVDASELAGERITAILTEAPGNGSPIDGLKVIAENGWFAARPSGTENVYKIYAESFKGRQHLRRIQEEAQALVSRACTGT